MFRHKHVIAKGFNELNKIVAPSRLPMKYRKYPGSIHAEMAALLSADNSLIKGSSILVVRLTRRGILRLAFPCPFCLSYLKFVGIRKIYYSTNEGSIEEFIL